MGKNLPVDTSYIKDDMRELRDDLKTKISDKTFWSIVGIAVLLFGGIFYWFMNINARLVKCETIMEMQQNKK